MGLAENLEAMLAGGEDSARLRFALGSEYLKLGEAAKAVSHLSMAVTLDPDYSAAWKLLGRAQIQAGLGVDAIASYERGIEAACRGGDQQAEREMRIFLKRLVSGE
jgi:Tfp pilus assembly protein PilF